MTIKILLILLLLCSPVYGLTISIKPTVAESGDILFTGLTYTGIEGVDGTVGKNLASGTEDRAYAAFDTSVLPSTAIITEISLHIEVGACASGTPPLAWINNHFLAHSIIEGDLPTNESAIWNGSHGEGGGWGSYVHTKTGPADEDVVICNTQATCAEIINVDGETSWAIIDESLVIGGTPNWSCWYNWTHSRDACSLDITYTVGVIQDATLQDASIHD